MSESKRRKTLVEPGVQTKLLVVDDIEDNRYTLKRRLRRLGFDDVDEACDGREALQAMAKTGYDVVFLDIMMPNVSGYEVLETLHEQGKIGEPPIIVISAHDEIDSVVRCIELGAEDYLTKPFNPTLLAARLSATLEKKRLHDAVHDQLALIRDVFGKFVPETIAQAIVDGAGELAPRRATSTILYTDIEGFTAAAQSMTPEQVVQMLNEYFPAVIEPIERCGGVVNQFQGDAMLVTFNVPIDDPAHADKALQAARGIIDVCRERTFAGVSLKTRIGINTGPLLAGNVGSGQRMNYTVHGDAVNVAARLEALNKTYGTTLLISASTVGELTDPGGLTRVGEVAIRGKDQSVEIYKLADD